MNVNTPASKQQRRVARLLGLEIEDSYDYAGKALALAGVSADGIPYGHTWRTAAKLSDAELLVSFLPVEQPDTQPDR
jgi:hypothetical protein